MKEGEQMNRINPLNNNTLRLVGIASGLDTDMVVQQLMTIEKLPLAKLQRQKQLTEWKLEAYREFTNALRSFKEQFFDIAKELLTCCLKTPSGFSRFLPLMNMLRQEAQHQPRQEAIQLRWRGLRQPPGRQETKAYQSR